MATKTRRLADLLANIDDNSKVTSAGLLDATITAADLADDSVGTAELIDDSVTAAAIATGAVVADGIGAGAVVEAGLGAGAVSAAKLSSTALASVEHVKPHIKPGVLHPAWSGLLTDNTGFTFTDSSATGHAITPTTNAHHSGGIKKIGSTSINLNYGQANTGTDHLYFGANHADFQFGTGDFTIEFWFNVREFNPGSTGDQTWIGPTSVQWGSSNGFHCLTIGSTPKVKFGTVLNSSAVALTGTTTILANTWYHYAAVRIGTSLKLYLNGVQEATATVSGTHGHGNAHANRPITIGSRQNHATNFTFDQFSDISVDDVRIVKGLGVYTGAFTAPATALTTTWSAGTNIAANSTASNVKLLLHSDNGGHVGAYGTAQSDGLSYYYTDIKGSKPIKDPRIGAYFGSQRHKCKSLQKLEQETATHGSEVYSVDGREWMKTYGKSRVQNSDHGYNIQIGYDQQLTQNGLGYCEIVGYFTSANLLTFTWSSGQYVNYDYKVDGGGWSAEQTTFTKTVNTPLGGRYVDRTSVGTVVTGLTLGIHTLYLKIPDSGDYLDIYGIELIAQDVQNFTATNATNILTSTGHTLTNGDQIRLVGSDLPNGLNATTTYYVIGVSGNNFQVSASLGGSAVTFSDDGSGTRTFRSLNTIQIPAQNVVSYGKKFSVSATAQHYNPFAFKTDGATAWASGAHNGTSWPVGTGASANIDTATSLGLENWLHSSNYYKPYNGGRVVKWIASDGTNKTSVNVMPPNAQNIASSAIAAKANASVANDTHLPTFTGAIDHSQAEVAKTFHFREFGNGNANAGSVTGSTGGSHKDFSMLNGTAATDLSFVMDDGLTTLAGDDIKMAGGGRDPQGTSSGGGDGFYITFIGTGIGNKTIDSSQQSATIAQNLPYGTHVYKHYRNGNDAASTIDGVSLGATFAGSYGQISELTFNQPKKPPIPEDAVIIADYMLMADYVKQTAADGNKISKGIRLLSTTRDVLIDATAGSLGTMPVDPAYLPHMFTGVHITSSQAAGSVRCEVPAFTSQCEIRTYDNRGNIFVDGTDVADSNVGSGITSMQTQDAASILGLHTVGARNNASNNLNCTAIGIVSPIHTSSHYQEFETPFSRELVGGDRNMEQNNLVVTGDGKTWDQLTRDTSYIGNVCVSVNTDTETDNGTSVIVKFDEIRGSRAGGRGYYFTKDFTMAYDRLICLKGGFYNLSVICYNAAATHTYFFLNDNYLITSYNSGADPSNNACTFDLYIQRGDWVQVRGGFGTDGKTYNSFSIKRV